MHDAMTDGGMWNMWGMGLTGWLGVIVLLLIAAALVKFLSSR
jgi:hypothetical protein